MMTLDRFIDDLITYIGLIFIVCLGIIGGIMLFVWMVTMGVFEIIVALIDGIFGLGK